MRWALALPEPFRVFGLFFAALRGGGVGAEGRGVGDTRGQPRAWGLPPVSPEMLAGFHGRQVRRGVSACRVERGSPGLLPRSWVRRGSVVVLGEAGKGVWGEPGTGPFRGAGGPGFPPVRFRIGPPSCLFT